MGASRLPAEAWIIIALIAGFMVAVCLNILAGTVRDLISLQKLGSQVRSLRERFAAYGGLAPPGRRPTRSDR